MNAKLHQTQRWEGSIVDGVYRLDRYLGEGETGAVYQTDFSRRHAVIKLIPATGTGGDAQLAAWQDAARLSHPHLVRILASGRSDVKGTPVIYLVTEYAEETMAEVLAERRLTPTEARDVLATMLDVLAYLHGQHLAHGQVKASNFLAVGDTLKLSIDSVRPSGDPGEDVRMLGAVFNTALDSPLPQPFLDITRHALDPNPQTRWTIPEIATRLDGRMPVRAAAPSPPVWRFVVPAVVLVVAGILLLIARNTRRAEPAPAPRSAPAVAQTAPSPAPPPIQQPQANPEPQAKAEPEPIQPKPSHDRRSRTKAERKTTAQSPTSTTTAPSSTPGILEQPMPDVPVKAMHTIHGKVLVPVRVDVDPSGAVTAAKIDGRTGSRYFAGFALKAARQWKFTPSDAPQSWLLRFQFTREDAKVSAARVRP